MTFTSSKYLFPSFALSPQSGFIYFSFAWHQLRIQNVQHSWRLFLLFLLFFCFHLWVALNDVKSRLHIPPRTLIAYLCPEYHFANTKLWWFFRYFYPSTAHSGWSFFCFVFLHCIPSSCTAMENRKHKNTNVRIRIIYSCIIFLFFCHSFCSFCDVCHCCVCGEGTLCSSACDPNKGYFTVFDWPCPCSGPCYMWAYPLSRCCHVETSPRSYSSGRGAHRTVHRRARYIK